MSRKPVQERSTNYGQIGITSQAEFERFIPRGFHLNEHRARIGHGRPRFDAAVAGLRTWQVQRLSGISVEVLPADAGDVYSPVIFDGDDVARGASYEKPTDYDATGAALLQPGDSAIQRIRVAGKQFQAPIRVISVLDEADSHTVTFGALEGHPEKGEERMRVTIGEDGAVHFELRVIWAPNAWWLRPTMPWFKRIQRKHHGRFMTALTKV
ncbi:DUF1990 family protein [Agrococcus casei]|uniref:DUF1990 family protein n=1 Tax=Agrococcus casei TaxID=343512 RepID=UPI000B35932A|nr:DUF1990 family protein [Agrococcus casei]